MKNSAPQPSARQVRCRRTTIESAMDPVPAGTGQQPRIVAGYNLFVAGLGFVQSCHNRTSTGLRGRGPPSFLDSKQYTLEGKNPPRQKSRDEGSDAPAVRMTLRTILTASVQKSAHPGDH